MPKKLKWFLISCLIVVGLFFYDSYVPGDTKVETTEQTINSNDMISVHDRNTKAFYDSIMNTPDMVKVREKLTKNRKHQMVINEKISEIVVETYSDVNFKDMIKDTSFVVDGMTFFVKIRIKPIVTVNGDEVNINVKTKSDKLKNGI